MSTCPSCQAWELDATSGAYTVGCQDCAARGIARGPAAWRSAAGITKEDLRMEVLRAFGEANYTEGRKLVWAWINRVKSRGAKL